MEAKKVNPVRPIWYYYIMDTDKRLSALILTFNRIEIGGLTG